MVQMIVNEAINEITDNIKQFLQILSSIGDMSQGKDSITAEYKKTEDEIKILNEKYANNDKESIATLCELIFDNKVDFSRIERPEEEVEPIKTLANRYCELDKNILSFEAEKRGLSDKYLLMFWNERYKQLIYLIWTEHKDLIPDALLETINRGINDIKTKQSELELSCKKREEIYSEYEKSYKKYVKKVEYSITNNGKQDNA